jgi:hypothetical protein
LSNSCGTTLTVSGTSISRAPRNVPTWTRAAPKPRRSAVTTISSTGSSAPSADAAVASALSVAALAGAAAAMAASATLWKRIRVVGLLCMARC